MIIWLIEWRSRVAFKRTRELSNINYFEKLKSIKDTVFPNASSSKRNTYLSNNMSFKERFFSVLFEFLYAHFILTVIHYRILNSRGEFELFSSTTLNKFECVWEQKYVNGIHAHKMHDTVRHPIVRKLQKDTEGKNH